MTADKATIVYTLTDEAPLLASAKKKLFDLRARRVRPGALQRLVGDVHQPLGPG